ncbi:uncharacterized protein [Montipora capricornis]|uniref:uncharacterized protein n=1 Tax=Montipora capricornis TaxID=246305 RepID=UPI0035F1A50F
MADSRPARGRPRRPEGIKRLKLRESTYNLWIERKEALGLHGITNNDFAEILLHQQLTRERDRSPHAHRDNTSTQLHQERRQLFLQSTPMGKEIRTENITISPLSFAGAAENSSLSKIEVDELEKDQLTGHRTLLDELSNWNPLFSSLEGNPHSEAETISELESGDHASDASDSETADSWDNSDQFSESDDGNRSEEEVTFENMDVDQTSFLCELDSATLTALDIDLEMESAREAVGAQAQTEGEPTGPAEVQTEDNAHLEAWQQTAPLLAKSSISEPSLSNDVSAHPEASPVTFHLVEQRTKRRKTLVDSLGFTYNVNSKRSYATYWQCTVRPKGNACKASIAETQRDEKFQAGKNPHNHATEVGAVIAKKIVTKVKEKALEDKFKPAAAIVNEVLLDELTEAPCPALPKPEYIARTANRLPSPKSATREPKGHELRASGRVCSSWILPGGRTSEGPTPLNICQTRAVRHIGQREVLVRRWHLQACTNSL